MSGAEQKPKRLPRGSGPVSQAFLKALDAIPAAHRETRESCPNPHSRRAEAAPASAEGTKTKRQQIKATWPQDKGGSTRAASRTI
jgi:hypothetical protein